MTHIHISHHLGVLQTHLEALQAKLGDLSPLMADIAVILEDSTTDRFASKTAPDGTLWQDILPASLRAKMRADGLEGGGGILVKSGDLARSIHSIHERYSASVGTDIVYGQYHQFGTQNIPKRPFLGVSHADENRILDVIEDYLNA